EWIQFGDAYVEFEAAENNLSHVVGLSQIPAACAPPCSDGDPGLGDINFALSLNLDGRFYVLEGGAPITGPDINGSFGTYNAGDRFRVSVRDNHDGTANVFYTQVVGACLAGNPCNQTNITQGGSKAVYPVRVDASFREANATVVNVTIVRIQTIP